MRRILGYTGVIFAQFVTVGSREPRVCGFRSKANCQTGAPQVFQALQLKELIAPWTHGPN